MHTTEEFDKTVLENVCPVENRQYGGNDVLKQPVKAIESPVIATELLETIGTEQ